MYEFVHGNIFLPRLSDYKTPQIYPLFYGILFCYDWKKSGGKTAVQGE